MVENELMNLARNQEYEKILNQYQDYAIASIAEVADFLRAEDVYKVTTKLYQHLLKYKETPDFHYGIGQCYGKTYNYETSLYHLEQAFITNRSEGANYYAYILERNFLMDRAYEWYHKALKNGYDDDLWTLSHYAYFLEKYNRLEEAKQVYNDVLTKNPAYTWAVKRYAVFLLKQNDSNRSVQVIQDALQKFPNNPFVKLNYLEYLIIRGMLEEYDEYSQSLGYDELVLPFQILIDLFDYFCYFLLQGKTDSMRVKSYKEKVKKFKDGIHRDFDDLTDILAANNGDLVEWKRLLEALLV
ncbi:tetratricopeptide repeat protein [Gloeocapsopsis crepidinum LEGE 06123]|uniref:Tetratricopeptide repeat protein n=1 Tax=Gloeocapsopsis crepidinum LEGE 06123 TaxID=588587 RepID=A0ABR9UVP0_9CHRO|nr:tetratricopeptide repeat protein [Gloeocapsopsis crepidinum]MBE9192351.1 tetratricopeptide repeat protein [Gloeocapsopsis crepidinum LEGE 06123]